MASARAAADGRVLAAGGMYWVNNPPNPPTPVALASAELYDPAAVTGRSGPR
jgi:hypothetical protein